MLLLRMILFASLLHLSAAQQPAAQQLSDQVTPQFQSIELRLDAEKDDYSGVVRCELTIAVPTDSFSLHARRLEVTKLELQGGRGKQRPIMSRHGEDSSLLHLQFDSPLAPGPYRLRIEFRNTYNRQAAALYKAVVDSTGYLFSQMEADEAREAFPCFDEPRFKIPYQLTLIVPSHHRAVSNTPIQRESVKGKFRTVVFERTRPLPSYLLAIATGPLDTLPITGMSVSGNIVTVKGKIAQASEAARMTPPLLAAMEQYFGSAYPYEKLDIIAAPEFLYGAMENPGAVVFRDAILLFDSAGATTGDRRRLASVMAHELAHMWFGNLVTMEWWNDLWLNESFASWMGDKIADQVYPEYELRIGRVSSADRAMITDARGTTRAIRSDVANVSDLSQNANVLVYNKGQAVLEMVEQWMGPDAFRNGMLEYLRRHEWNNATANDLWAALGSVTNKPVDVVLASYVAQPGMPVVSIDSVRGDSCWISQQRHLDFQVSVPDSSLIWSIPLGLRYRRGDSVYRETLLFDQRQMAVSLAGTGPLDWLYPNDSAFAYCRWRLPADLLARLTAEQQQVLSTEERIASVHDLTALLRGGSIEMADYLASASGIALDTTPAVLTSLLDGLTFIKQTFVTRQSETRFAAYVRTLLTPPFTRIGLEAKADESAGQRGVRRTLLEWLCDTGADPQLRSTLDSLLTLPRQQVDNELWRTAVYLSGMWAGQERMQELKQSMLAAAEPEDRSTYFSAIGNLRDSALTIQALNWTLQDSLRPQEVLSLPRQLFNNGQACAEIVSDWVIASYDSLLRHVAVPRRAALASYVPTADMTRLERAEAFFSDTTRTSEGVRRELERTRERVEATLALRQRYGTALLEALP